MSNLDMSLDDMIKMNKTSRAGPRSSGPGPTRRFSNRSAGRRAPYSFPAARAPETSWDHGKFAAGTAFSAQGGARVSAIETGSKLLISNLHYGVSDDDIRELFAGVGDLKSSSINYDRSGRSEGTAEVVYFRRRDAETAIKRFNNVQLDGKPMKIEIVGTNTTVPPIHPPASYGRNPRVQGRGGAMRRPQGGGRGMRRDRRGGGGGGGGGGGRGRGEKISAEDLDADLEKYLAGAKEAT